jgi:hypothetical protein
LLDTGSEEVWLADSECGSCRKTQSLCPHLKESKQQVSYFRGSVRGDFTYLNTCFGPSRVLCVKEAQDLSAIESHGIMGIRGNSSGRQFLDRML